MRTALCNESMHVADAIVEPGAQKLACNLAKASRQTAVQAHHMPCWACWQYCRLNYRAKALTGYAVWMRVLATSSGSTADHMMVPARPPQPMADAESLTTSQRLGLGLPGACFPGNVRRRLWQHMTSSDKQLYMQGMLSSLRRKPDARHQQPAWMLQHSCIMLSQQHR